MTQVTPIDVELICLDMAGTTVSDAGMVEEAFQAALDRAEPDLEPAVRSAMLQRVRATMGMSKIEVFTSLLGVGDRAARANAAFESAYEGLVRAGRLEAIPGAAEVIAGFAARGVRVALITGFSVCTRDLVIESLGWAGMVDLALSPADVGRGRPYPDLILTAARCLRASAMAAVAVAGDTPSDMESARAAGAAWVVGVLSGVSGPDELWAAGATHVVDSVVSLPGLLWPG